MRQFADGLLSACEMERFVVHRQDVPPCAARFGCLSSPLAAPVQAALEARGVSHLYTHQVRAIEAVRAGQSVLVVTPTASGKSLVYNLPVLESLSEETATRALYIFPFKALEQDQKAALEQMLAFFPAATRPHCAIYDGDTLPAQRRRLRSSPPEVLITNPDMLHLAILAHHGEWAGFLAGLKYVVMDELHVYRGVFGSHLHHIMKRLRRLCRRYGSRPTFILSSATVGEPGRLAAQLLDADVTVVDRSGAPQAGRHMVFLNPGMALSPYTAATRLMAQALGCGRRVLTFTKARRITELIHSWLLSWRPELAGRVASYRAGYLAGERREIERGLAAGTLQGVVSTSALELGIDIGGLDVCILVGYPGSITSAWQRMGRVGRKDRDSLVLLVGMPDALDQYFLTHPEEFFNRPFEPVVLDPANPQVAAAHLICAAAESPLLPSERTFYGEAIFGLVDGLVEQGRLICGEDPACWCALARRPQRQVGLRSSGESFEIREARHDRPVGTVDAHRARTECHPGAIYLHRGATYRIESLDLIRHRVVAAAAPGAGYFTQILCDKETEILERLEQRVPGPYRAGLGRLKVTTRFTGYLKKRLRDQVVLSEHPLDLPPAVLETVGLWVELPQGLPAAAAARQGHLMGAIHATEHAAIALFPLLALCDRGDLGGISYPHHGQVGGAAFFIYDGHAGGMGLAAQGFRRMEELLARTRDLLASCPCEKGCPSCVHSPRCGNGNRPLDKAMALFLLEVLTGRQKMPGAVPPAGHPEPVARGTSPRVSALPERPAAAHPEEPPAARRAVGRGAGQPRDAALARRPQDLFFDLETLRSAADVGGWQHAGRMGLALAMVYQRGRNRWRTYRESDAKDLIIDLLAAERVVGFNIRRFDLEVLSAYSHADLGRIEVLDLLEEIHQTLGFRLSLDHLCQATLGEGKSGHGLESLAWVKEGRWDRVEAYCRKDVELTMRLFDHGRRKGYLLFHGRQGQRLRLPVHWG